MTRTYHCMFEQSGTFKNEFKALGYEAYDYDILNDYGETDYQIDLFKEIEKAYDNEESIFDQIKSDDVVLAFFPCTRFDTQIYMHFQGTVKNMRKWTQQQKLEYCIGLHTELHRNYVTVCKLRIVCLNRGLRLIIENPYSGHHYLLRYFPIKATFIDYDRREMGDYYTKPTQWWFIGFEPSYNFIFEPQILQKKRRITAIKENGGTNPNAERSLISKEYANRFIREYVL